MLDSDGVVALASASAPATNTDYQFEDYSKIWCYCSQPSFGTMIMCNNIIIIVTVLSSGFTVIVLELETHLIIKGSGIALPVVSHQGSIIRKRANNNTAVIIEIILFSHSSHEIINHCHKTQKYYNLILGNNRCAEIN